MDDSDDLLNIDYMPAGVPPSAMLDMNLRDLWALAEGRPPDRLLDTALEVALIGLVAYFEAFCKNQFAAAVNAFPELLAGFTDKRQNALIPVRDVAALKPPIKSRLGFLLAEKYDFGSAKSVNALFRDLLGVTPISNDEARQLNRLLNDRNLLVHHGGIHTSKYADNKYKKHDAGHGVFFDSLVVTKDSFFSWHRFIEGLAHKICDVTQNAVSEFTETEGLSLDEGRKGAVMFLGFCE